MKIVRHISKRGNVTWVLHSSGTRRIPHDLVKIALSIRKILKVTIVEEQRQIVYELGGYKSKWLQTS
jgi:hypothetical protein